VLSVPANPFLANCRAQILAPSIALDQHVGILDLMSPYTADDFRTSCRRFMYTVLLRARGKSNAGVRPSNRGGGRAVEERHEESVQPGRSGHPRWPAAVALLIVGALYAVISEPLTFGPRAFLLALVSVLLVPLASAHQQGRHRLARLLGLGLVSLVTVAVVVSVFLLISSPLSGQTPAQELLQDAALLWVINLVTFAVWYWEIDGGGPGQRRQEGHVSEDFLFPQMNLGDKSARTWSPGFLDYLFLAFNTSTAFSPTDTAFLSRRAKVLMMVQALLSLVILAVLVSRAINTLAAA
jgi:uncharacterized membrane protein